MKRQVALIVVILISLIGSGCMTRTQYITRTYQCAPRPELPKITAQELASLSDSTFMKLVERELRLKEHVRLLEINCERGE